MLTDTPSYVDALRNFGYDVHLLPRPSQGIETYVNSLLVNEVIFMPTFQIPETDKAAAQIYESLGFRVIQLDSKNLSNHGMGSIHCITMTYPKVDLEMLIQQRLRVWR